LLLARVLQIAVTVAPTWTIIVRTVADPS
jgi:hypothetical protein